VECRERPPQQQLARLQQLPLQVQGLSVRLQALLLPLLLRLCC
jgi:hypothetical protein